MFLFELFFKGDKPIYARGSFLGSIFHLHAVGEILLKIKLEDLLLMG